MSVHQLICQNRYFAAANGYTGFRSRFGSVFPSETFTHVFVLKGGPGTGKSSLLCAVADRFSEKNVAVTAILCSSDPDSLDGVILEKDDIRIAMIDGTAPHERDAVIPGCIDELVNLGEHWQEGDLRKRRAEILTFLQKKKRAYQSGYEYLTLAGTLDDHIRACERETAEPELPKEITAFLQRQKRGSQTESPYLLSAFGRLGMLYLPTPLQRGNCYALRGEHPFVTYAMERILRYCEKHGIEAVRFSACLRAEDTDALFFPQSGEWLLAYSPSADIPAFSVPCLTGSAEKIRDCESYRCSLLHSAQAEFSAAAEAHAALEKIYGSAMRFEENDRVKAECLQKINSFFEKKA